MSLGPQRQRSVVKGQSLFRATKKQEVVENNDCAYPERTCLIKEVNHFYTRGQHNLV